MARVGITPSSACAGLAWLEEGENIRVADAFVVDIMLNAGGESYDTMKQHAETIDLDEFAIRTVVRSGHRDLLDRDLLLHLSGIASTAPA